MYSGLAGLKLFQRGFQLHHLFVGELGFFWGDVSLSNVLFRRDAGAFTAYLVDAVRTTRGRTVLVR